MDLPKLKPISEQVVVIVGASSGMGRATALRLASEGARVAVMARNTAALDSLVEEIQSAGGYAAAYTVDVTNFNQFRDAIDAVAVRYGGIDTFANFAATAVYAPFMEISPEEFRRIIDVNLTGQANGAIAALPHLRRNGRGALILISSIEGFLSIPYHSAYAASKHGLNGMIQGLRMELQHEASGVSVTGVMPAGVNTPFFSNARTKLGVKPRPPKPIYRPEDVANVVLYAATHRVNELYVGGAAKFYELAQRLLPNCIASYVRSNMFGAQRTQEPKGIEAPSNLFAPETNDSRIHGDFSNQMRSASLYVWFQTHPEVCFAMKLAAYVGLVALLLGPETRRHFCCCRRPRTWRDRFRNFR